MMDQRNRRRLQALLIVAIFLSPVLVIGGLMLAGWVPHSHSYGTRIQPERDLASMTVHRADGQPFAFRNHDAKWTLVALPGPDCAQRCLRKLDLVHRARLSLGRHADKLRLLYLGEAPKGFGTASPQAAARAFASAWTLATTTSRALEDLRPAVPDSVSVVLVTPDGKALTHYVANFDAEGLRQDLEKAVH